MAADQMRREVLFDLPWYMDHPVRLSDLEFIARESDNLRCYGDGSTYPFSNYPPQTPREEESTLLEIPSIAKKAYDNAVSRLQEGCTKRNCPSTVQHLAQHLFHSTYPLESLAHGYSEKHNAAIAACAFFACTKLGHDLQHPDNVVTEVPEGSRRRLFFGIDPTKSTHFPAELARVTASFRKAAMRSYRRKMYERAEKRGKQFKQTRESRIAKQICGRDVDGVIRTEVYLAVNRRDF